MDVHFNLILILSMIRVFFHLLLCIAYFFCLSVDFWQAEIFPGVLYCTYTVYSILYQWPTEKTLRTKLLFFTCWHQPTKQHHNIFYVPALVQSPAKTIRGSRQQLGIGLSDEEQKSGFSRNRCCQNNVYNYREHHFVPLSIKKKMNVSWLKITQLWQYF